MKTSIEPEIAIQIESRIEQLMAACAARSVAAEPIKRAVSLAVKAHSGQTRSNDGGPYVRHPLEVATMVCRWGLSSTAIQTAHLHDVKEDAPTFASLIAPTCGPIVDEWVSILTQESIITEKAARKRHAALKVEAAVYANGLREVGYIKLADRINNLQTCAHFSEAKRLRFWNEGKTHYVPLAVYLEEPELATWMDDARNWATKLPKVGAELRGRARLAPRVLAGHAALLG